MADWRSVATIGVGGTSRTGDGGGIGCGAGSGIAAAATGIHSPRQRAHRTTRPAVTSESGTSKAAEQAGQTMRISAAMVLERSARSNGGVASAMARMMAMVRFDRVGLSYARAGQDTHAEAGPEVLHDLSFVLPDGSFRWLLGPSGAGKTSLLRLMYLAIRPTRGRLAIFGTDVETAERRLLPQLRRRIGVVFQDFRLLPHLSAFDNVALPLRIAGRPEGQIRADVGEMLRWVGLAKQAGARPAELSGGEQQRVAIARAVIARPSLLLADEPTGNLDDVQAERLMQLFKEMNRLGTTVVVATHNDGLVSRHPAEALRLSRGRLAEER